MRTEAFWDTLDYGALRQRFGHVFAHGRPFVMSTSLDALLTSLILGHTLHWRSVGVYAPPVLYVSVDPDSRSAWEDPEATAVANGIAFVGASVCRTGIPSIGAEVLHWSDSTPAPIDAASGWALNPNVLRGITHQRWERRYRLGLASFALCCLEHTGNGVNSSLAEALAPWLLYVGRSFPSCVKRPAEALAWAEWLGLGDQATSWHPLGAGFCGLSAGNLVQEFRSITHVLGSLRISPVTQSLSPNPTGGWGRIRDTMNRLQEITGLTGNCEGLFEHPPTVFAMHRHTAPGTLKGFLAMRCAAPFTYRLSRCGTHAITYFTI